MEITQQVRDYAAKLNAPVEDAREKGMEEMSEKFREMGEKLYVSARIGLRMKYAKFQRTQKFAVWTIARNRSCLPIRTALTRILFVVGISDE